MTHRSLRFLAAALLAVYGCASGQPRRSIETCAPTTDERLVWQVAIPAAFGFLCPQPVVIQIETAADPGRAQATFTDDKSFLARDVAPGDPGLIEAFLGANPAACRLRAGPGTAGNTLVSESALARLFATPLSSAWRQFRSRYPKHSGIIRLSRVGFDSTSRSAVVYADCACGPLCGGGAYILLERVGSGWHASKVLRTWES